MDKLEKTLEKFWKDISKKPNVIGYSGKLKPKIVNGKPTKKKVIRVYVSKKLPLSELSPQDLVPASVKNGSDEIETDIIEIGEIKALGCYSPPDDEGIHITYTDGRRDRHRPLVIGPSAMGVWSGSSACTLGGFAKNTKAGEDEFIGILANNHCCAQENKAAIGTTYIQPSPYDSGNAPADKIGTLWRFVEIKFNEFVCPYRNALHRLYLAVLRPKQLPNTVDIGFVKLDEGVPYTNKVHNVGIIHGKRDAVEGDIVSKFGRTTGLTIDGNVIDIDWSGSIKYSRGTVFFQDCVLVVGDKFSQGGDSSSFTFTQSDSNREYIGNLFAGSDSHSIICKYSNVESRLEVEVLV